jgi:hypothetical protein
MMLRKMSTFVSFDIISKASRCSLVMAPSAKAFSNISKTPIREAWFSPPDDMMLFSVQVLGSQFSITRNVSSNCAQFLTTGESDCA